ncbi:MAG: hypothetical protein IKX89_05720, partial [Firmicutes bacterium]|nr:hypothetical protein [Bacillota bacterium]
MKRIRIIISMLLVLALVAGLMPAAFAADVYIPPNDTDGDIDVSTGTPPADLSDLEVQAGDASSGGEVIVIAYSGSAAQNAVYSGGTGTKGDPFIIATADDLRSLSQAVAAGSNYENSYLKLVC